MRFVLHFQIKKIYDFYSIFSLKKVCDFYRIFSLKKVCDFYRIFSLKKVCDFYRIFSLKKVCDFYRFFSLKKVCDFLVTFYYFPRQKLSPPVFLTPKNPIPLFSRFARKFIAAGIAVFVKPNRIEFCKGKSVVLAARSLRSLPKFKKIIVGFACTRVPVPEASLVPEFLSAKNLST